MIKRAAAQFRFAPSMHFATPKQLPSLVQGLAVVGLIVLGVGVGVRLAPAIRRWSDQRSALPRRSAPAPEIDRWANEGGSVVPPAIPKVP